MNTTSDIVAAGSPVALRGWSRLLRGDHAPVRLHWALASLLSLVAGALLALGFQPFGLWPTTVVGIALLSWLSDQARARRVAWCGLLAGLALYSMTVSFQAVVAWWLPVLMVPVLACWVLLTALGQHYVQFLRAWPLWSASIWTLVEALSARFPFGGFAWDRLAFTLPDQPLGGYLWLVGAAGAGWLLALSGCLVVVVVRAVVARGGRWLPRMAAGIAAMGLLAAGGAVLSAVPATTGAGRGVTVGVVQGNVDGSAGPHTMGYARSVTDNHLSETIMAMARARTGLDAMPDFLAWPENSTDMDPNQDEETHQLIADAQAIAARPILVGAVTLEPGDDGRQTAGLWWDASGETARYAKRNAVPFGEFTPLKDLVFAIAPMAREVGRQTIPGTAPGVITGTLPDGSSVRVGDIICYELAFDSTVYDTVRHGAEVVVVQSNNATYAGTMQPRQQFAITRVRAMEMRREVVVSTTSSLSGLIDARGRVVEHSQEDTAWARTFTVPTRQGVSAGVSTGPAFEAIACAVAAVAVVAGLVAPRRARRGGSLH
ncbi:apolipoprotein N-acyltransferase [Propionibacterium freudenreichii]|uniref:apolipoprotein N-acyltransferase n=1 Tax=Propionibacterium freudenreichii TaxID=1744 RepID=UPI00254E6C9A|nr:apolipoprotein N-acyltransferase [Propionibacterium freudenreichii]MDK9670057.1 apolipoprotein N-acyltransferase [Propionibacterium freudenreichii]MDK9673269.1 apolipoprotein N-acyltransferase [Propionibacterium freudenreichii]